MGFSARIREAVEAAAREGRRRVEARGRSLQGVVATFRSALGGARAAATVVPPSTVGAAVRRSATIIVARATRRSSARPSDLAAHLAEWMDREVHALRCASSGGRLAEPDAFAVQQAWEATQRLRTFLRVLGTSLPRDEQRSLQRRLRKAAKRLGALRRREALCTAVALRRTAAADPGERLALEGLARRAGADRERAHRDDQRRLEALDLSALADRVLAEGDRICGAMLRDAPVDLLSTLRAGLDRALDEVRAARPGTRRFARRLRGLLAAIELLRPAMPELQPLAAQVQATLAATEDAITRRELSKLAERCADARDATLAAGFASLRRSLDAASTEARADLDVAPASVLVRLRRGPIDPRPPRAPRTRDQR